MSRIDDLPPDRRAVLQLILKQNKGYEDLASLLRIDPSAVRDRAHDALRQLGPTDGAGLSDHETDEVADYLLGQQSASEREATRTFLEQSAPARAWARVVAGELKPLVGDALPEIPAAISEVDEAFEALDARTTARERQAKSSRLGGVLLLGAVGIAVAFIVILLASSGSSNDSGTAGTPHSAAATTGTTSTGTSTTPQVLGQVNLKPPAGHTGGLAAITLVRQGAETDILFQGQGIPANQKGDVYALWVTGPKGSARLGFTPRVKANGKLRFPGALPGTADLSRYTALLLTRETVANPTKPGPVVLVGALPSGV